MHGQGTCEYRDGSVFTGSWLKGVKHGTGTLKKTDGTILRGRWKTGKLIDQE
ncbi:hypothetical protein AGMMS50296_4930 [Alphaproteobacteria bacterium]|nr:hypothetical protein AGMMS50296_4930 [Alphaproteobacteria bacterium]